MWKVKALSVGQTRAIQKGVLLGSVFLGTKLGVDSLLQFSLSLVLKKSKHTITNPNVRRIKK